MSPKRGEARVSPNGEAVGCIWVCIHMQIPIDMTTFTYCIFALGHILARQFPIVGFRPPVRLIDIIGRAADTRLHFYLHTFADQFEPTPLVRRSCCGPFLSFRFPDINDWTAIFVPARRALRAVICVSYFRECGNARGVQVRRRWTPAIWQESQEGREFVWSWYNLLYKYTLYIQYHKETVVRAAYIYYIVQYFQEMQ